MSGMAFDFVSFSDLSATSPTFTVIGGRYFVAVTAGDWSSGSVTLDVLGPDGATYVQVSSSASLSANGAFVADLPPHGTYQLAISDATGVYAALSRVPVGD